MSSANEAVVAQKRNVSLFEAQKKAYPRFFNKGTFRRVKWAVMLVLLGIYWLSPWLRWDRGPGAPDQAILIDLPAKRAYFFFIEIWPQEVYYLTGLLIIAALGLFFVSALLGRVWCGFTCFQTVWTDLFVWIEQMFEGDRNRRMQLDKAPWSVNKVMRKAGKHACWIIISVLTGYGFVLYFGNAPTMTRELLTGDAGMNTYSFLAMFASFPYIMAGFAREQVCIYMCPYSRFQGAMFDEHSLIVSYEAWRGEPRGKLKGGLQGRKSEEAFADRGHCVDCRMCVQVCPTGIDIREGSQMACIGCALCVDACNSVMDQLGLPRGLISYDSQYNQSARAAGDTTTRTKVARPRVFAYLGMIMLVVAVMTYALATKKTYDVNVLHERAPVYVQISGDRIRNGYTLKILNMVLQETRYKVSLDGVDGATMNVIGIDGDALKDVELDVPGDSVGTYRLFVTAPRKSLKGKKSDMAFVVTDMTTGKVVHRENFFAGPEQ